MTTAPASDLKFSHNHFPVGCDDFAFPPLRASATTLRLGDFFGAAIEPGYWLLVASCLFSVRTRTPIVPPKTQRGDVQPSTPPRVQTNVDYLRCLLTSFVISNIETWPLPPNT